MTNEDWIDLGSYMYHKFLIPWTVGWVLAQSIIGPLISMFV